MRTFKRLNGNKRNYAGSCFTGRRILGVFIYEIRTTRHLFAFIYRPLVMHVHGFSFSSPHFILVVLKKFMFTIERIFFIFCIGLFFSVCWPMNLHFAMAFRNISFRFWSHTKRKQNKATEKASVWHLSNTPLPPSSESQCRWGYRNSIVCISHRWIEIGVWSVYGVSQVSRSLSTCAIFFSLSIAICWHFLFGYKFVSHTIFEGFGMNMNVACWRFVSLWCELFLLLLLMVFFSSSRHFVRKIESIALPFTVKPNAIV